MTVHGQIGHNAQKQNMVFLQHHISGTIMSPELIVGVAVIYRRVGRSKCEAYCYYRGATALQNLTGLILHDCV